MGRAGERAGFYHRLLGWPIVEAGPRGGWLQLQPPEGESGPTVNIEEDRHHARPVWPSEPGSHTMAMHLDIGVDDLDEAVCLGWRSRGDPVRDSAQEHV